MNIALGFGSNEEDFERQEFSFVEDFIKSNLQKDEIGIYFFTDSFVNELKEELKKRELYYRKKDEEYDTSKDYPDRYSTYYSNVLWDGCDLCVIFRFSHINRRHSMSPDGWALLCTSKVFHSYSLDF